MIYKQYYLQRFIDNIIYNDLQIIVIVRLILFYSLLSIVKQESTTNLKISETIFHVLMQDKTFDCSFLLAFPMSDWEEWQVHLLSPLHKTGS